MSRTKDKAFAPCPLCGRPPHLTIYAPNMGWAYCKGTLFRPHEELLTNVGYMQPSELIKRLADNWISILGIRRAGK